MRKIIGLIIADPNEIHQLNEFKYISSYLKNGFDVEYYQFNEHDIYVCHSRIGLVNSSIAAQHLIDEYDVNQIWNYGAVGGSSKLKLHQVVVPNKFFYFDVITPWYKFGQVPMEKECYFNSIKNTDKFNIASGQSFINKLDQIKEINNNIDVDLFDMEACAIAQTCYKNNIGFYCVKGISDIIGKSKTSIDDINKSIAIASKKSLDKMVELLFEELNIY